MFKSLLSFFAVVSLWTVTTSAQDTSPDKPKTDNSKPADKKSTPKPKTAKADEAKPVFVKTAKGTPTPAPKATPTPKPKATPNPTPKPTPAPTPKPTPKPTVASKSTPAPSEESSATSTPKPKHSLFGGVFHGKKEATPKPESTPAVTTASKASTPAPKTHRHKPAEKSTEPASEASREPAVEGTKPETEKTPETKPEVPAPVTGRKGRKGKAATTPAPEESAPAVDPETAERNRFNEIKSKAEADPQVLELKNKAYTATTDEEGKKAMRTYNKALFSKMRKLDGSLKDHIDIMESVILKDLEQ